MESYRRNSSPGFTLIELLITMAIFASIMTLLLQSYFQFQIQSKKTEDHFLLRQEIRSLEQIMRDDLQSVVYLSNFASDPLLNRKTGINGIDNPYGEDSRDAIHMHVHQRTKFYRDLSYEKDPLVHEVSYYVEEVDGEKLHLKRREEFYIDDDITEGDESVVFTLSENLVSFDVQYYDRINPSKGALAEWEPKRGNPNPSGVSVKIVLKSPNGLSLEERFVINLNPDMGSFIQWD